MEYVKLVQVILFHVLDKLLINAKMDIILKINTLTIILVLHAQLEQKLVKEILHYHANQDMD